MKIIYAASNFHNSRIQLARFLDAMHGTKHQIKIAAYKKSSPKNTNIDWTLDALLNVYKPEYLYADNNDNLEIYFAQIKAFKPDLIISDLEYFTSYLAGFMSIPIWQCSSSLINYALLTNERYGIGLFKYFAHSLNRDMKHTARIKNMLDNSTRKLVYSHYGDLDNPPSLASGYEWIKPYHKIHKIHVPCQHYIVAGLSTNDKKILQILKQYPDSILFREAGLEEYKNISIKDLAIIDEYYCNLRNSKIFICQGQSSFLADAFYNSKYSCIYPNYDDSECLINSTLSKTFGLGDILTTDNISMYAENEITSNYNNSTKYLHELII